MKNFEQILSDAGVELTGEQKTAISKEIGENYKTIADWQKQHDKVQTLETTLKDTQDKLKAFDGVDADALNGEIAKLKADLEQKDKDYQAQIADRDFQDMLKEAIASANGRNDVLPDLIQSGTNMISSLATGLQQNLPQIMSAGGEILSTLANGIVEVIPTLASTAYDIVMNLLSGITNNADSMLNGGSELLLQFITGISEKIPDLLVAGVQAVISLAMALTEPGTLGNIISAGIELILGLLEGLINAIPKLLEAAPILMARFVAAIIENIPKLLSAAVEILVKMAQYMVVSVSHLLTAVPQLFLSLVNSFKSMDWGSIGQNIIDGIWNGLTSGWSWLVDQVKSLASNLFNAAKEALDINSPSRKFKYLGEMCVAGFDDGIDGLMNADTMSRSINACMSTMQANMTGARSYGGVGGFGSFNQTINVNQQISTPDELARAVRVESRYGLMRGVAFG